MVVTITPDLAGFLASRSTLYANFGISVAFLIPKQAVWPTVTPLTPFGSPVDPWETPTAGGDLAFASAFVTCTLVTRPYGGRGQVRDDDVLTPIGSVPGQMLGLNIQVVDYPRVGPGAVGGTATHVAFWGERFQIREWRADGVGGLERYIVYISQSGGP